MRARTLIGLDVGSRVVKALQLTELKGRYTVSQFARAEISPGLTAADAIAEVFARRKFAGRRVVTAVSGKDVYVRFLSMPAGDFHAAAKYEIGKFIPVEAEDVLHDSYGIEDGPVQGEKRVVLAAAKRAVVEEHVALLEGARLDPVIVDVAAFALGNAYSLAGLVQPGAILPGQVVALVDIGATRTTIHVLRDDISYFTRELYKGVDDLAAAQVVRETAVRRRPDVEGPATRVIENPTTKMPIIIVADEDAEKLHARGPDTEILPIVIVGEEDATKLKRRTTESGAELPIVIVPEEDATKLRRLSEEAASSSTQSLPIVIVPEEDATKLRRKDRETRVPILIVDPEDATKLRRLDTEVRGAGAMDSGTPLQDLCNEIVMSLEYVEAQHDFKVERILLTGGGGAYPALAETLEEAARRPAAPWNPVERMELAMPEDARAELIEHNLAAAVAFGLASRIRPD